MSTCCLICLFINDEAGVPQILPRKPLQIDKVFLQAAFSDPNQQRHSTEGTKAVQYTVIKQALQTLVSAFTVFVATEMVT